MVVLYPHTLVSWRHIPRTKRAAHAVARGVGRGDGALAIVFANRPPEISQFPRNARRRGRRRYGKSPNAIVNRKFPTTNYPPPSTSLHFYTAKAISHDGEGAVATALSTTQLPTKSKNRKFPTTHYPLSTTNYHLHLYTSTRPFFKSLNAPILKCNRKSEIAYCVRIGECGIIRARFCN